LICDKISGCAVCCREKEEEMKEEEALRVARQVINQILQTNLPMNLNLLVIRSVKTTRHRIS
jgi:20S proteasome alpha/beta subunit